MDASWTCLTPPLKSESKSASLTKPTPSRISHSVYHSDPKCRRSTDLESAAMRPRTVVLTSTTFSTSPLYAPLGISISVGLATSGKSCTAGFEIGCKISLNPGWHKRRVSPRGPILPAKYCTGKGRSEAAAEFVAVLQVRHIQNVVF